MRPSSLPSSLRYDAASCFDAARSADLECADTSALWSDATCRVEESDVMPSHSTPNAPIVHPKMNSGKEPFKCGMGSAECGVRPNFDFRLRQASCAEPARPVAPAEFGMRLVGRVTPCAPSNGHLPYEFLTTLAAGRGLPALPCPGRDNRRLARHTVPGAMPKTKSVLKGRRNHSIISIVPPGRDYFLHVHRGRCPRLISDAASRLCALASLR